MCHFLPDASDRVSVGSISMEAQEKINNLQAQIDVLTKMSNLNAQTIAALEQSIFDLSMSLRLTISAQQLTAADSENFVRREEFCNGIN